MVDSLRDFVYINEESLNSNLSSLGRGVLEEITEESGAEAETSGGGSINLPSFFRASGSHSRLNTENVTSTMRVLAPYRFQSLESLVESEDIPVFDGTSGGDPSRGDTIRLEGEVSSMSLFKLESALNAFTELLGGDTIETLSEVGDENLPDNLSSQQLEQINQVQQLVSQFTGSAVPLRMDINGYPIAVPLEREFMRTSPEEEFLSDRKYTVFGRVENKVSSGETWDPVNLTRIVDKYAPQEGSGAEFRANMTSWASQVNISLEQDDMLIKGPASVVSPIAMYW
ncbi:DUF6414 family protein [Halococcus salsus]|uniref:DUF6414 family protein n=1 Tax=Halococcus salsus TaxID=2162894 RepID=UPI00135C56AA|nr:hypothetical protein [Halococcus salsus]